MVLPQINPTQTQAWQKLKSHFEAIKSEEMKDWFVDDPKRAARFQIEWQNFLIDYSKNRVTPQTLSLLLELAEETRLQEAIEQQFSGALINETEARSVLHTALRQPHQSPEVRAALDKMKNFSEAVISGKWKSYSGKKITDIVNIGIGGSDLGPQMAVRALQYYRNHLRVHFVSNVDGDHAAELSEKLDPETTLFIVVSKSFSTLETLTNARFFKRWFLEKTQEKAIDRHFVAVTSNTEKALDFGANASHIFPIWDWVGGRFSLWSCVGLSLCCAIGFEEFKKLLRGAHEMDQHFYQTPFKENIPVVLGLISIWYNNFFQVESEAVIPYADYLSKLVPYLQQAFMESNGKNISRDGKPVSYQTGSLLWGSTGTNAQHAFFQLLHQGTKLVPCDFIGFKKPLQGHQTMHCKLMSNFFAQTEALMKGKSEAKVWEELKDLPQEKRMLLAPYKTFPGNKPSTTILIEQLTPENLGSLIALYEHKIFVQGIIWNIFSYDQWGVELGKELATTIMDDITHKKSPATHDSSTASLLKHFKTTGYYSSSKDSDQKG